MHLAGIEKSSGELLARRTPARQVPADQQDAEAEEHAGGATRRRRAVSLSIKNFFKLIDNEKFNVLLEYRETVTKKQFHIFRTILSKNSYR